MSSTDVSANLSAAETANGAQDPSLSLNISGIADWSPQLPFIDFMKFSRPFSGATDEKWGAVSYEELKADGLLDANGYPTSIPSDFESISTIWSTGSDDNLEDRKGVYIFEYEGEGTLGFGGPGIKIISEEPGRIVFENTLGKTFGLNIFETDPNGDGDYLRDFSLIREEHVELHEAGAIFNPDWLPLVEDLRQVRLMDWFETNNSTLSEWDERPTVDQASWMAEGVPVEIAVRLANELGTDAWFTVPHGATEEYIREFATYVRDNLDPRLQVSAEFSNEIWNFSFGQTKSILEQVQEEWGNGDVVGYGLKLQTEAAQIWDEVFANEPEGRLIKVLGGQAFNSFNTEQLMDARGWFAQEPDEAILPSETFDAFAITTYFGHATTVDDDLEAELLAAIADPDVDAMAYLEEKLLDPDYSFSIPFIVEKLSVQKAMAAEQGLDFIAYEGGQHVHHRGRGELGDFLLEFNRSDHMANLYQALWDAWEELGDGPFMQFGDVGLATTFASFAMLRSLDDTTPRSELLYELNETVPAWWEDDREEGTFLHGVVETGTDGNDVLIGTYEEDYLIGGDGDDVFAPGRGDDGVHGGAGRDIVQVNGVASDYTVEAIEKGVLLIGPDGVDLLVDVEEIMFEDGTVALVDDLTPIADPDPLPEPDPEPDPDPEPEPDPDAHFELQRGDFVDGGDGEDSASFVPGENGIRVMAINPTTELGGELGLEGGDNGYVISDKSASATFDGEEVGVSYWSMLENAASKDGEALSDTALDTALAIGAVATNVETIEGSAGNDMFVGGAAADHFLGGDGDDRMLGRNGDDVLEGGAGDDDLFGGQGADTLNGGDGDDVAHFKGSRDDYQIETVENGVLLVGPDGTDLLIDVEELMFSDGSVARVEDLLNAGEPEPDPLPEPQPEEGSVYELQRGDLVEGGSGEDVASFLPEENGGIRVMGINASTAIGTELGLEEGDGGYVITDKSASAFFAGEEVYASYWSTQENVAAKDGPTLGATALDTALALGAVVSGVEKIEGTDKNDMFVGASADDHFAGGDGADRLLGRNGDDLLEGGGGDDRLYGGAGEDTLIGGDGSDVMSGGAGQNTFVFGEGDLGVDYLTDFKIGDVIDLQGFSFGGMSEVEARASASDDGVYIDLGDGAGFVLVDISLSSFDDITILT